MESKSRSRFINTSIKVIEIELFFYLYDRELVRTKHINNNIYLLLMDCVKTKLISFKSSNHIYWFNVLQG